MTENNAIPSGETLDTHQPIAEAPFAPVYANQEDEDGVIAVLCRATINVRKQRQLG